MNRCSDLRAYVEAKRNPGPFTWIRQGNHSLRIKICFSQTLALQAFFMIAPSITTPELTYFQSATSNFRASATIIGFFRRPLF